ncbi:MAG: peptidoglycan-binding protein, partial [Firmicutes bacterium]|nr:peptidoglycan-binding protein [Bacillota bacterium]
IGIGKNPPTAVLSAGSRGLDVVELPFLLNYISAFYPTVPGVIQDGAFGPTTKNAVIEFQKTFGLTADGVVGPATWNKLYAVYNAIQTNVPKPPIQPPAATPPYQGAPLRLGSTGAAVRTMQSYLNGINAVSQGGPALTVDGIFGPQTQEAVRNFQRRSALAVDGIIGPLTWDRIVERFRTASGSGRG